jgi:DNA polymerase elongation subunit (family B)
MRSRGRQLTERKVDPRDLALVIRISRALDDYSVESEQVSALRLLREEGTEIRPGEKVRFVVIDHEQRQPDKRVCLLSDDMDHVEYDVGRYLELAARAATGVLSIFGVGEVECLEGLRGVEQLSLDDY